MCKGYSSTYCHRTVFLSHRTIFLIDSDRSDERLKVISKALMTNGTKSQQVVTSINVLFLYTLMVYALILLCTPEYLLLILPLDVLADILSSIFLSNKNTEFRYMTHFQCFILPINN